jgi:hypothetical protein
MSETLRENAQWRKGKSPIIGKYIDDHKKLMSAVAGRGFTLLPGFAYDIENDIEIAAKSQLSELNYKIIAETIERELKQTGIDYDIAYKAAAIQWEIDKQVLMAAWDAELANIKKGMAEEEELLDQLAIETNRRGVTLLEQKTIIELAAEAYRTQLATLDATVAPYEVALANAKLLTAQKKLDIIPILQSIVAKEQELLASEQSKAASYTALMVAEQGIITKKQTRLLPAISELVNVEEQYTGELAQQIALEKQIADEKVTQAGYAVENAQERIRTPDIELDIEAQGLVVMDAKMDLSDVKSENETNILEENIAETNELKSTEQASNAAILNSEKAAQTYILDRKRTAINTENSTKESHSSTINSSNNTAAWDIANSTASKMRAKADLQAAAEITSKLTHIIGG